MILRFLPFSSYETLLQPLSNPPLNCLFYHWERFRSIFSVFGGDTATPKNPENTKGSTLGSLRLFESLHTLGQRPEIAPKERIRDIRLYSGKLETTFLR